MWRLGFILILKLFEGGARRPKVYTLTESISTSNCSSAQPKSFSLIDISLFSFVSYISLLSTITASDKKKINKINRKRMMLPHCINLNSWFLRIFCFFLSFIYFFNGLFMLCYFLIFFFFNFILFLNFCQTSKWIHHFKNEYSVSLCLMILSI